MERIKKHKCCAKTKTNHFGEEIVDLFNERVYGIPMNYIINDKNNNVTQLSAANKAKASKVTKLIKQTNQNKQAKQQNIQLLTDPQITEKRKKVVSGRIIP